MVEIITPTGKKRKEVDSRMEEWNRQQDTANEVRTFESGTATFPKIERIPTFRAGYTAGAQSTAMDEVDDKRERRMREAAGLPPDIEID